ncbi:hypothetical protein TRAPUB_2848 [Trametes pubescens]|uniref:Uncharacterized protein n=1 Tax=Trametes pubescens TaxID=154538 RepID=A0A1M2VFE6_TRAPU|nr:hypothetical protein TRAPUB_2848 [Trametes pubescens]
MRSLHRSVAQQKGKNTSGTVIFDAASADPLCRTDSGLLCDELLVASKRMEAYEQRPSEDGTMLIRYGIA